MFEGWCVWLQNIDGIMFARQFDTVKHSECYRPIPVHTPSSRRLPVAKQFMNSNADTATSPRYDQEYDYKTTHYPSYPPNYPYDENNKYKYEQQTQSSHHHHHHPPHQPPPHQQQPSSGQSAQPYGNFEKPPTYQPYEDDNFESRNYLAPQSTVSGAAYPTDTEYSRYSSYEGGRSSTYSGHDTNDYVNEKGRYGYGYERAYYDVDGGGRYISENNRHDTRYPSDSRHDSGRNANDGGRDVDDLRYNIVDGRDGERRYVDGRDDDVRYESRDGDSRYVDGRTSDGRYESGRYQSKENYYDRYYKHRPSRDHHTSETSRY